MLSSALPQHAWPILEPIMLGHFISICNSKIGGVFLLSHQTKLNRAHKEKSRYINTVTDYQRLLSLQCPLINATPADQQG